jgi:hypothetical protein
MSLHGALMLEGSPALMWTGKENAWWRDLLCSAAMGGGPECSPDAQMHTLHMSLHGALMLEGTPALMLIGQKDVLEEGPSVLSCHGESPISLLHT